MLVNLWYVAEWANKVKDQPVKAKLLGQNFVLFRNGTRLRRLPLPWMGIRPGR
jgi:hypothetical protein